MEKGYGKLSNRDFHGKKLVKKKNLNKLFLFCVFDVLVYVYGEDSKRKRSDIK